MCEDSPDGWKTASLLDLADYVNGFAFNDRYWSESGLPIIRIAQITGSQDRGDYYDGHLPKTYQVSTGDIIFSWSGTLTVSIWKGGPAWLNQHLFKVIPNQICDASFLFHLLRRSIDAMAGKAHGSTMKHIKREELAEFKVMIPVSNGEQTTIAHILDTLDTAIEKTEAIIGKLEAIKRGLLHDLLTRGVDESGKLRPPREEAPVLYKETELGWVPREWEVTSIGELATLITSGSRDWARYYSDVGSGFIRIGNLTREHINLRLDGLVHVLPPEGGEGSRTQLHAGDLLISITADLGIIGVVPPKFGEAYINQHIALVRIDPSKANVRCIGHFLAANEAQVRFQWANDSGAKAGLNLRAIGHFAVCLPTRKEQHYVADALDSIDQQILAQKVTRDKLVKSKSGLMDDLLTGRVRVTRLAGGGR